MKIDIFRLRFPWIPIALALFLATGISIAAHGQEARPKGLNKRIDLLESQVDELQKTLQELHGAEAPDHLRKRLKLLESKLDEFTLKIDGIVQTSNTAENVNGEQSARLDDLAKEIAALWQDVQKHQALLETKPPAGYDNGFYIGSKDGKFKLTIGGFVRPYYRIGLQKVWQSDQYGFLVGDENSKPIGGDVQVRENTFGLANGRLILKARILEFLHGKFEIDFGTVAGSVQYPINAAVGNARYSAINIEKHSLRFLDVYGEYAPLPEIRVRIGQFKVPFDKESLIYSNELTFTTRSLMTRAYPMWGEGIPDDSLGFHWNYEMQRAASFGRDTGLEVSGSVFGGMFQYQAGVFNGSGDNTENDNRDVLVALRLATDPLGSMTPGMSDLETVKKPLLSVGAAFSYDLLEHVSAVDPLKEYNSSDLNLTADVHFKWHGIAVLAAMFYRHADHGAVFTDESGDNYPIDSLGLQASVSYFNDYTRLEPAFRYSVYDADMERKLDHVHEITAALGYHPFLPHVKVLIEYRGLFAAQTDRTYLVPYGVWYDYYNEISIMAQMAF